MALQQRAPFAALFWRGGWPVPAARTPLLPRGALLHDDAAFCRLRTGSGLVLPLWTLGLFDARYLSSAFSRWRDHALRCTTSFEPARYTGRCRAPPVRASATAAGSTGSALRRFHDHAFKHGAIRFVGFAAIQQYVWVVGRAKRARGRGGNFVVDSELHPRRNQFSFCAAGRTCGRHFSLVLIGGRLLAGFTEVPQRFALQRSIKR